MLQVPHVPRHLLHHQLGHCHHQPHHLLCQPEEVPGRYLPPEGCSHTMSDIQERYGGWSSDSSSWCNKILHIIKSIVKVVFVVYIWLTRPWTSGHSPSEQWCCPGQETHHHETDQQGSGQSPGEVHQLSQHQQCSQQLCWSKLWGQQQSRVHEEEQSQHQWYEILRLYFLHDIIKCNNNGEKLVQTLQMCNYVWLSLQFIKLFCFNSSNCSLHLISTLCCIFPRCEAWRHRRWRAGTLPALELDQPEKKNISF